MQRKLTFTVSKLCGGTREPPFKLVRQAIKALRKLIDENANQKVLRNACRALSYLSGAKDVSSGSFGWGSDEEFLDFDFASPSEILDAFHKANVLPVLVKLLMTCSTYSITCPAILTVQFLIIDVDKEEICIHEAVFEAGLIDCLGKLVEKEGITMGIAVVAIASAIDGIVDDEQESWAKRYIGPLCDCVEANNKLWVAEGVTGIEKILKLGEAKKANTVGGNVYAQMIKELGEFKKLNDEKFHYELENRE
ncbi:importin subunit alpha-like [Lycium barbarum]|uniref:importin subunit alpha-like n=1 Tax=Lycium barbarum TaxID=112863 RepID=UPI00293F4FD2|nr:importin subunit alpha-like [Lycium barbarum]XP_060188870.1 importin subunit alpha-like [Lycium barbarum]XP_060188871.1 importin subunit alpha-like [Lycium barbarum]XP_060188872.1 importin subunit alpha-like [Lycium barbarum]XP_060188873.1 importin subunit alpha-like [Lycium barbarum]XP_060188874.1 importin subunit alpha-like [Lycium barbarum]